MPNYNIDIREASSACGEQGGKRVDGPKEDEGIGRSKLGGMGMMGRWMEVRA
jgi:hypothetical protein